jgi:hypothetical protein
METLRDLGESKIIVFVDSKETADFVAVYLCNNDVQVEHIRILLEHFYKVFVQATSIHGDRRCMDPSSTSLTLIRLSFKKVSLTFISKF